MGRPLENSSLGESPAIVGCGAVTALGRGLEVITDAMLKNTSGLKPSPHFAKPCYQTAVAGLIPGDTWSALHSDYPDKLDCPAFTLALDAINQTERDAKHVLRDIPHSRRGMVLATTKANITALEHLVEGRKCSPAAQRHILPSELAEDLASAHGIAGPVRCVSVACISGLVAIQEGCRMILRGEADAVYVAGVDVVSHFVMLGFSMLKSLDPEGCRPFDKSRTGLSLGEGAGAVLLARRSLLPDKPHVLVRGWGTSNDANHLTGPSRDGGGLALAIGRALTMSGCDPSSIEFVSAHGTGTVYNDGMESLALKTVFGEKIPPVSSCKGMIGHTLGAAGIIETIMCVLAARGRFLPGTPRLTTRDDAAPASVLDQPKRNVDLHRALKINAGFGGVNGALVLEMDGATRATGFAS